MRLKILLFGPQAMLANSQEIELELAAAPLSAAEIFEANCRSLSTAKSLAYYFSVSN